MPRTNAMTSLAMLFNTFFIHLLLYLPISMPPNCSLATKRIFLARVLSFLKFSALLTISRVQCIVWAILTTFPRSKTILLFILLLFSC